LEEEVPNNVLVENPRKPFARYAKEDVDDNYLKLNKDKVFLNFQNTIKAFPFCGNETQGDSYYQALWFGRWRSLVDQCLCSTEQKRCAKVPNATAKEPVSFK